MSKEKDRLEGQARKLRDALGDAEAVVTGLRARLARVEAKLNGEPEPVTGLDMLWTAALPTARTRSSKVQCRQEWARIPAHERPPVREVIAALKTWNRCEEWKKASNAYVPALHRWIKNRQWENLPETSHYNPMARYGSVAKPVPVTAPEDVATPEYVAEMFKAVRRMKVEG